MSDVQDEPMVFVKAIRAENIRKNRDESLPSTFMKFRINKGGHGEDPMTTEAVQNEDSPQWDQSFNLRVRDPENSQLECTIWGIEEMGEEAPSPENFYGEVILNLAKLIPFNHRYLEQQGKTYPVVGDKKAQGKLKIGLQFNIPDNETKKSEAAAVENKTTDSQTTPEAPKDEINSAPEQPANNAAPAPVAPAAPEAPAAAAPPPAPPQAVSRVEEEEPGNIKPSSVSPEFELCFSPVTIWQLKKQTSEIETPKATYPPAPEAQQDKITLTVEGLSLPRPYVLIELEGSERSASGRTSVFKERAHDVFFEDEPFVFGLDSQKIEDLALHFTVYSWHRGNDESIGVYKVIPTAGLPRCFSDTTVQLPLKDINGDNAITANLCSVNAPDESLLGPNGTIAQISYKISISGQQSGSRKQVEEQMTAYNSPINAKPPSPSVTEMRETKPAPEVATSQQTMDSEPRSPAGVADVGLVLAKNKNSIAVADILYGSPAAASGQIRIGDVLIDVDGHDVRLLSFAFTRVHREVQNMLRGDKNSPITMIFQRAVGQSQEQVVVTILRAMLSSAMPSNEAVRSPTLRASPSLSSSAQDDVEGIRNLKKQFSGLSFIWGDKVHDSVEESMNEWRADMIFGPKKDMSSTSDAPQENVKLRRSLNQYPAPIPQVSVYRSIDNSTPTYARDHELRKLSCQQLCLHASDCSSRQE
eukprot:757351-Hanusia_phi.AAC.3